MVQLTMDPNTGLPGPQPTSAPSSPPQAALTNQAAPVVPPSAPPSSSNLPDEEVYKNVKRTSSVGLVLGALLLIISILLLGVKPSVYLVVEVLISASYILLSLVLRRTKSLPRILLSLRLMMACIALQLVLAILNGQGAGFLPLLLLLFIVKALKDLREAGLISSTSLFKTKPTL